ncbi:MAG: hypothetical protein A3G41_06670 [Elusimicrobia bacterium RIFCSPLOWO2_12_FULL_59_9]|nr:MAG: hypothetical protein A3G41_06670 [Elusimicrobia bacterium RIFCSPLOWO2_12_FULL_59_9]
MKSGFPELKGEPGWSEVWPFPFWEARRSFTGPAGMEEVGMRYFKTAEGALVAKIWFGPSAEGAPGRAHGGALLTVLDEAMGAAAWVAGIPVLTARLETAFRRGVPLAVELLAETKLLQTGGRTLRIEGSITDRAGTLYAQANGVFARLTAGQVKTIFSRVTPA